MRRASWWRRVVKIVLRRHDDIKSFEHDIQAIGSVAGSLDLGARYVATEKIVGSVNRWRNLRSDFFYRTGNAVTARFKSIGKAMREGKEMPPVDLYKVKVREPDGKDQGEVSRYYVVDGHHRIAMARKLGRAFVDARVVEYKVNDGSPAEEAPGPDAGGAPSQAPDRVDEQEPGG